MTAQSITVIFFYHESECVYIYIYIRRIYKGIKPSVVVLGGFVLFSIKLAGLLIKVIIKIKTL